MTLVSPPQEVAMRGSAASTANSSREERKPFVPPQIVQHKSLTDGTLMLVTGGLPCITDPANCDSF